ncbi:hypothetical protein LU298_13940 [Komagataeibacter intermedius]|uniref:Uncharacterized protein n=1 Tax=Komagataeibacter intermedius AF2 TaxID=1458464 RepID=A0A0C1VIP8_9PROT|nr:hypothetical protein [Komagataeibacter intermedius]KPH85692.1 hypothetical protein GLUCOINTEAF2_0203238 [Komagataeibacter intermedius AF2]KPH88615.1 hypothetical protein GLUCOINTEAF2_0203763 [Komagataeibacter intermedius AF2]MCF3637593.1 hypothetical protein [Komagataeibacter intermedius]GAN87994.1 hypothetical protein Gain_0111_014 [Komagataeibacter intermedius TF2]
MLPDLGIRPAGLLGVDGACIALGLVVACGLVLAVHVVLYRAWPAWCVLLRGMMLSLVLPGLGLALWWPRLAHGGSMAGCVMQGLCIAPAAMWPLLRVLDRIPPGLSRTASGLGADAKMRLRLLWLPLLGLPVAGVAAFSLGMIVLCAMTAVGGQ